eukprot:TRINITY_DN6604_c0_g1_i1.p1 TRINITY_DN6604_c0_g1~~TRINITY_DN6604_c0_g1_i1.p1  ORF type:complete len:105 (+),score=25.38 TRINITY_DN6604_c0_g1_i1:62-376(+)
MNLRAFLLTFLVLYVPTVSVLFWAENQEERLLGSYVKNKLNPNGSSLFDTAIEYALSFFQGRISNVKWSLALLWIPLAIVSLETVVFVSLRVFAPRSTIKSKSN